MTSFPYMLEPWYVGFDQHAIWSIVYKSTTDTETPGADILGGGGGGGDISAGCEL